MIQTEVNTSSTEFSEGEESNVLQKAQNKENKLIKYKSEEIPKANQKKKVPKKFFNSKNSLTKMPRLKTKKKENLRKIRLEPVIKKKPSIVNKLESISFANDN